MDGQLVAARDAGAQHAGVGQGAARERSAERDDGRASDRRLRPRVQRDLHRALARHLRRDVLALADAIAAAAASTAVVIAAAAGVVVRAAGAARDLTDTTGHDQRARQEQTKRMRARESARPIGKVHPYLRWGFCAQPRPSPKRRGCNASAVVSARGRVRRARFALSLHFWKRVCERAAQGRTGSRRLCGIRGKQRHRWCGAGPDPARCDACHTDRLRSVGRLTAQPCSAVLGPWRACSCSKIRSSATRGARTTRSPRCSACLRRPQEMRRGPSCGWARIRARRRA